MTVADYRAYLKEQLNQHHRRRVNRAARLNFDPPKKKDPQE